MFPEDNVLSLINFKKRFWRSKAESCKNGSSGHRGPFLIDDSLENILCEECGKYLSPIYVIHVYVDYVRGLRATRQKLLEEEKRINERKKCKCDHCGKFTNLKV